jgi:clan AA aspartic protease
MGITFVKVKVSNPARPKKKAVAYELLVDSGAIYSLLPARDLKKLGIKPVREEEFTLANGETVKRLVGNALFELHGKIGAGPIIFGDEGVYLLGVTALEAMGFMLDPLRQELKPAPMLLMAVRGLTGVMSEPRASR